MAEFGLCGVGHALVDVLIDVSEAELNLVGAAKGTMGLVTAAYQQELLQRFADRDHKLSSGGSVCNSVVAAAALGSKATYIGTVGDDTWGQHFLQELKQLGIQLYETVRTDEMTGTCLSLITPDSERTMLTCLGAAAGMSAAAVPTTAAAAAQWVLFEGYLLGGGDDSGLALAERLLADRETGKSRFALTLSDLFVVQSCGALLQRLIPKTDLLFANAQEAQALTGAAATEAACLELGEKVPEVVVTAGAAGVYLVKEGSLQQVAAYPCQPVDMTGAGDMFCGAYLHGILEGRPPESAARGAAYMASQVISVKGARLAGGHKEHWAAAFPR